MKFCSNRPEGFGPSSSLSSPLPTSCFTDIILLPLPTWLALATLPPLILLSLHHRKTNFDPSTKHLRTQFPSSQKRFSPFRLIKSLYYILIICNILMQTLEIIRLELLRFGIGLLPFCYVGLLLGGFLHFTNGFGERVRGWRIVNLLVWIGGVVMCVLQVLGLNREGTISIDARKGSKYPIGDQVLDVVVMAGVYAVVAGLEIGLGVWERVRRRGCGDEDTLVDCSSKQVASREGGVEFVMN